MTKKRYVRPAIVDEREVEALTGTCIIGDGNSTGMEKLVFDPNTGDCINQVT